MGIVAIVPAKSVSTRVPNKNYREFYCGESLVDITLQRLLAAGLPGDRIYLSCDDTERRAVADRHGVRFLPRDPQLCSHMPTDGTPQHNLALTDWIRGISGQVPGDDDVAWAQVIDPLFDQHAECLRVWREERGDHDSLAVCYPAREYLLGPDHRPLGWGFGEYHTPSQLLPTHYRFGFTFSILPRSTIARCGYHIGRNPLWFHARNHTVDIDTPDDWRLAQVIYGAIHSTV